MYMIKAEIFNELKKEIMDKNKIFFATFNEKKQMLNTIEFIKIVFSETLLEDLDFLMTLSGEEIFKVRHANVIIRDLLEQTIEFIYLSKNPELVSDYMGENLELDEVETDLVEARVQFGKKRYKIGRKSISKMAEDINEKLHKEDRLSLYEIYRILSEDAHNSYYQSILDDIEQLETKEIDSALTEEHLTYLMLIIDAFMKSYR